ncbi:MAG: glycosyltransferase [candidate division Zixibacteria bacterium]|nr:glycosyltransferase [candidate division Zixibacteria bacterium]
MKILSIGNFIKRKRFDLCVRTCTELRQEKALESLTWRIIGGGPEREEIMKVAKSEVELVDRVDSLREHYQWADLFVLPSYDEGFGLVYVESIMCGCPIIGSIGEGATEIVEQTGGGILVEIPDSDREAVKNIKRAILEINANYSTYMNREIIQKAVNKMDPVRIQQEWEVLIEKSSPLS